VRKSKKAIERHIHTSHHFRVDLDGSLLVLGHWATKGVSRGSAVSFRTLFGLGGPEGGILREILFKNTDKKSPQVCLFPLLRLSLRSNERLAILQGFCCLTRCDPRSKVSCRTESSVVCVGSPSEVVGALSAATSVSWKRKLRATTRRLD